MFEESEKTLRQRKVRWFERQKTMIEEEKATLNRAVEYITSG